MPTRDGQFRRIFQFLGIVLLLASGPLLLSSCAANQRAAGDTLGRFIAAVQSEDLDALYCLMAGASESGEPGEDPVARRETFEDWVGQGLRTYEEGRDRGWVELDGHGILLVKLFALGRGTFFAFEGMRSAGPDASQVDTRLQFGYGHINLSHFTPGTTFYVSGVPIGRVHPVRVPAGAAEIRVDPLRTVLVRWTLIRAEATAECPAGWAVAGVEPVDGSEQTTEITWVF